MDKCNACAHLNYQREEDCFGKRWCDICKRYISPENDKCYKFLQVIGREIKNPSEGRQKCLQSFKKN